MVLEQEEDDGCSAATTSTSPTGTDPLDNLSPLAFVELILKPSWRPRPASTPPDDRDGQRDAKRFRPHRLPDSGLQPGASGSHHHRTHRNRVGCRSALSAAPRATPFPHTHMSDNTGIVKQVMGPVVDVPVFPRQRSPTSSRPHRRPTPSSTTKSRTTSPSRSPSTLVRMSSAASRWTPPTASPAACP